MTCGIYQLSFQNKCFYVGQSVDIENRWKQHFEKLSKGTAAKPMLVAFNTYGYPRTEILLECHEDYLDMMESIFIHQRLSELPRQLVLNTNIPKEYSQEDVAIATKDSDALKLPITQLLKKLRVATANITALEDEVQTLRDEGIVIPKEIRNIRNQNIRLNTQLDQLIKINQELSRRANMSWFDRLFS